MTPLRIAFLTAALALSACMAPEPASRGANAFGTVAPQAKTTPAPATAPEWNVRKIEVEVPRSLYVSEANLYVPLADIVWRGDPRGDRYAQVDDIVTKSAQLATKDMRHGTPVVVQITMKRFHALSEIARYSFGGSYGMQFDLTLRDARTGAVISGPRTVTEAFPAVGGRAAIEQESRGITEKVVITQNLQALIRKEVLRPLTHRLAPRITLAD